MGGIDHHHVAFRLDQGERAAETILAHAGCGGDAQAAALILGGVGIFLGLFDIFHGDEADAAVGIIHHENFFDAVLMQQPLGFFGLHAFAHGDELFLRHQFVDGLARIVGEAHIAVGENADEFARALAIGPFDHGNTGNRIALHQGERIGERCIRSNRDRVHHHAAFELLHAADLFGLLLDSEVLVDHADAARLGHGDGQTGFGDRVHGGGNEGDAEFDRLGEAGPRIHLTRQDF